MFLQKVEKTEFDNVNELFEARKTKKWNIIADAVLGDKVNENDLNPPIDNDVMDDRSNLGRKMPENKMKLVRLFEL